MAGEVNVDAMNGLLKRVYDPKLGDLRPKSSIIQRKAEFSQGDKVGESYQVGVAVQPPNGFTYLGSAGNVKALSTPQNSIIKQASITPFESALREQVSWAAMSRAAEAGEAAIKSLTGELVIAMRNSTANRLEASLLHGQRGYGTVASVTDLTGNLADVVFTEATFAPGLFWALGPGSRWDSWATIGAAAPANTLGALVLKRIDSANRKIVVSFTGAIGTQVAAGHILFPTGANAGTNAFDEMPGFLKQASNTTGDSLGLNATTYPNWSGNLVDVAGANPSHGIIEDLLAVVRDRGAEGQLSVYVPNKMFSALAVELAQLITNPYKPEKGSQGFRELSYFSPDVDEVRIINHPFMKLGEALILPDDYISRVGSSDITFGIPGMPKGQDLVQYVNGYNAAELGTWTDQAGILKRPNWSLVATGFAYL